MRGRQEAATSRSLLKGASRDFKASLQTYHFNITPPRQQVTPAAEAALNTPGGLTAATNKKKNRGRYS